MVSGIGSAQQSVMIQTMFAKTDTDANGSLTLEEFKAGGPDKAQAPVGGPTAKDIFAKADVDGDGSVTEAEFTTLIEEGPKRRPPPRPKPQMSDDMTMQILEMLQSDDISSDDASESTTSTVLAELLEALDSSSEDDTSSGSVFDYTA